MPDQWYVATLLMQIRVEDDHVHDSWTCDEQIRMVRASDDETALEKAIAFGRMEEIAYKNEAEQTVFWEFVGVIELNQLDSVQSKMVWNSEAACLRIPIQRVWSCHAIKHSKMQSSTSGV